MKKIKYFLVLLLSLFLLVGCEDLKDYLPTIGEYETYYITFMVDGEVVSRIEVSPEEEIVFPEDPVKEGYDFLGWYNMGVKWEETTIIENSIVLTAKFGEPNTVLIDFIVDDSLYHSLTINPNESIVLPVDPYKDGYKFIGWECNGVIFDENTVVITNVVVNAVFEEIEKYCVVEFYIDGTLYTKMNYNLEEGLNLPVDPYKDGYEFIGWECDGVFIQNGYIVYNDLVINAVFKEKTLFTIDFIVDGVLFSSQSVYQYGSVDYVEAPVKEGYNFLGWYCNGDLFDFGQKITESIVVEAVYEKIFFDLNWQINDPGSYIKSVDEYGNVSYTATSAKYEWSYIYKNLPLDIEGELTLNISFISPIGQWNIFKIESVSNTGEVKFYEESIHGTGEVVDFSFYISQEYLTNMQDIKFLVFVNASVSASGEITFVSDDYQEPSIEQYYVHYFVDNNIYQSSVYYVGDTLSLPSDPYKEGYSFVGWMLEDGTFCYDGMDICSNLKVFAVFEEVEEAPAIDYYVNFMVDGEVVDSHVYSEPNYYAMTTSYVPYKEGYTFIGWFFESGEEYVDGMLIYDNFFVYAKFEQNEESIDIIWNTSDDYSYVLSYDEFGRMTYTTCAGKQHWSYIYTDIPNGLSGDQTICIDFISSNGVNIIFKVEGINVLTNTSEIYEIAVIGTGGLDSFKYDIPAEFFALVKDLRLIIFIGAGSDVEGESVSFDMVSLPM